VDPIFGALSNVAAGATVQTETSISTVVVSPGSADVEIGQTQIFSAEAYDSQGSVVPGVTFTWSSTDASIASVDSAGLAKGLSTGNTEIHAQANGVTGSASLVVHLPPPPPAGGMLFSDDFESGSRSDVQNGFSWSTSSNNVTVENEIARSGSYSLRFRHNPKNNCEDSTAQQNFSIGQQVTEFWMEYYLYFPDGSESFANKYWVRDQSMCSAPQVNNKGFRVYGGQDGHSGALEGYDNKNLLGFDFSGGLGSTVGNASIYPGTTGDGILVGRGYHHHGLNYRSNAVSDNERGRWVQLRLHVKMSTDYQTVDGVYEFWWDGVKLFDSSTLWISDVNGQYPYWERGYIFGWANSGFDQETKIYLDDFQFYTSDPGWS
jgi:hypothetical protein